MNRHTPKRLSIPLLATLLLALGASLYLYPALSQSFFEPTGGFPGSNTETPLNVGPLAQVKQGALTLLSQLDLSNTRGVNLKDPINPQDAVTKGYVDRLARGGGWVECASYIGGTGIGGTGTAGDWADGCNGYTEYKFSCINDLDAKYDYWWNTAEPVDFSPSSITKYYYSSQPDGAGPILQASVPNHSWRLAALDSPSTGLSGDLFRIEQIQSQERCNGRQNPQKVTISYWDPSITLQASFPTMPTCPAYVMGEKGSIMTAPRPFFENYVVCKNRETGYVPHCQFGTSCELSCLSPDNSASMVVKTSPNFADCFRPTGSTFNISEACYFCMIR